MKKPSKPKIPHSAQEVIAGLSGWSKWKDFDAENRKGQISIRSFKGIGKVSIHSSPFAKNINGIIDFNNWAYMVYFYDELECLSEPYTATIKEGEEPMSSGQVKKFVNRFLKLQSFT